MAAPVNNQAAAPAAPAAAPVADVKTTWTESFNTRVVSWAPEFCSVRSTLTLQDDDSPVAKVAKVFAAILTAIVSIPVQLLSMGFEKVRAMFQTANAPQPQAPPAAAAP